MELINATPLPARVFVSKLFRDSDRIGLLLAKATYRLTAGGVELETQAPYPLFGEDQETELGLLPRDDFPRRDDAFEVVLLGAAHAAAGHAVERRTVALSVGDERRELTVFGDRRWEGDGDTHRIGPAEPFVRMPLTYERAFGGTVEVEIDEEAFVPVSDPRNPRGRGFNPEPVARSLCEALKAPAGYPRHAPTRSLPNVEDPTALICTWEDSPDPAGWGALPLASALQGMRSVSLPAEPQPGTLPSLNFHDGVFHRAHPTWVIDRPELDAEVTLTGLSPSHEVVAFRLPQLRVYADYVVGPRAGRCELEPHLLMLLPEVARLYLVFRFAFAFDYPSRERSMRLRFTERARS